jgi:hypothetical protein
MVDDHKGSEGPGIKRASWLDRGGVAMWSGRRWQWAGALITGILLVGGYGCAVKHVGAGARGVRCWLITEVPGGRIAQIPCRLYEGAINSGGIQLRVGELDDTDLTGQGAIGGLSGSPIVDSARNLLGADARQFYYGDSPVFGMSPVAQLDAVWDHVPNDEGVASSQPVALDEDAMSICAGRSIMVQYAWGDLELGVTGTITERRRDRVLLFAHGINSIGKCRYSLRLAPVVAVVGGAGRGNRVCTDGPIIGTVVFDGAYGCVGVLGRAPNAVRLEFRVVVSQNNRSTVRLEPRVYFVIPDSGVLSTSVSAIVADALPDAALAQAGGRPPISLTGPGVSRAITPNAPSPELTREAIRMGLAEEIQKMSGTDAGQLVVLVGRE